MSERTPIDLSGTFLPVNTPFDPTTGDVDIVAYRDNLSQWFEHPISGILTAGSTGESVYLDDEERRTLVAIGRDVAPEGRLVIAGTGSESTRHTILLTRQAADAGADAVLVSPPAFFKGAMTPAAITTPCNIRPSTILGPSAPALKLTKPSCITVVPSPRYAPNRMRLASAIRTPGGTT